MMFLKCPSLSTPPPLFLFLVRLILWACRGRVSLLELPILMELCSLLEPLAMGSHRYSFPQHLAVCSPLIRFCLMPPSFTAVNSRHGCFLPRSPSLPFYQFFFVHQNYATWNRRKGSGLRTSVPSLMMTSCVTWENYLTFLSLVF